MNKTGKLSSFVSAIPQAAPNPRVGVEIRQKHLLNYSSTDELDSTGVYQKESPVGPNGQLVMGHSEADCGDNSEGLFVG